MPSDQRKRQRKLERRAAKRKDKRHQLAVEQSAGLAERLADAARFPVLHAWISEILWEEGLCWVLLSREIPGGSVAIALFLIDSYCIGVKDALSRVVSRTTYQADFERKMKSELRARTVSPAMARKFVEAAAAYAFDLGFPPHPDYARAKLLFGTIDPGECQEELELGDQGRPHFIAGPYDTALRCRQIVDTLTRSCGPGRFDVTLKEDIFGDEQDTRSDL